MEWPNPIILKNGDGIIPLRAAKPRVKELKILNESRKLHFNSHASHNFSPWAAKPRMGKNYDAHGNWYVPWVTNWEFIPSPFFKMMGLGHSINLIVNVYHSMVVNHHLNTKNSQVDTNIYLQDIFRSVKKPTWNMCVNFTFKHNAKMSTDGYDILKSG